MENVYSTIDEALEDLRNGKIIIVSDDEDRENEGDLICAAEFATTENINFMATYAKGLICMPMSKEITNKLNLNQMVTKNTDNHETAFTVIIMKQLSQCLLTMLKLQQVYQQLKDLSQL